MRAGPRVRAPAVAGFFYPAESAALGRTVDALLDAVPTDPAEGDPAGGNPAGGNPAGGNPAETDRPDRAYVVPHAGYRYSGSVAAYVYSRLRSRAEQLDRIVLIGPTHFVPVPGCAVASAEAWSTPLGPVPIDVEGSVELVQSGLAVVSDDAHAREHALEVQLPFLRRVLPERVPVLPIVVGRAPYPVVAAAIERAVGEAAGTTVVLCSTDLSHYLDQESANQRDRATVAAILALDPEGIAPPDACGFFALRGLLGWAAKSGLTPRLLRRCTSADTAGDPSRVVGYAAVALA